ncbi:hypothetical protein [Niabella aurantiaca]|uniref:hypothetical protein n=1 Tax=Niabella aurantiaca TaxID=379900 RepID=UPI0012FA0BC9|nr:hypothetical protein [Niabella aurantiaca]
MEKHQKDITLNVGPILEYFTSPGAPSFSNSWYAVGENRGNVGRPIFEWDHIPAGFLYDLVDNNNYNRNITPALNESNPVVDTVSGYSISTIYSYLDGSTSSPAILMNKLRNNLPNNTTPINTLTAFDALRSSYGY